MATTLSGLRAGLAANLATAFTNTQVFEYVEADPAVPCFEIDLLGGNGIQYDSAMARGLDEYDLIVRGMVGLTTDQGSQVALDSWLDSSGAGSVKAALESDKTLGGVANSLQVTDATVGVVQVPSVPNARYLAAEWRVHIWTHG